MIADTQCRFLEGVFFGWWEDQGPIGPIPTITQRTAHAAGAAFASWVRGDAHVSFRG